MLFANDAHEEVPQSNKLRVFTAAAAAVIQYNSIQSCHDYVKDHLSASCTAANSGVRSGVEPDASSSCVQEPCWRGMDTSIMIAMGPSIMSGKHVYPAVTKQVTATMY